MLMAATLACGGSAHGQAATRTRYACPATEELTVERHGSTAHVNLAGRSYDLRRRRSSIGDKYVSPNAALIIDSSSAVFVADNQLDLGTCIRTVPLAAVR